MGFRVYHSSDHVLIKLVDSIFDSFNERKHTIGIFVDLSKVFDTLDQDILINKLYGVKGIYLHWFKNYLTNRKQYIECNDFKTGIQNIKCIVPQGSIIGPQLL